MGAANNEFKAKVRLAEKLQQLGSSLAMKEASNRESGGGGGQSFNRNDGNSFSSDTTYHSYVWNYCMNWIGNRVCERWLDPYVAIHGLGGERSQLEKAIAEAWLANEKRVSKDQYKIWNVQSTGPLTDVDGKLDKRSLKRWELTPEVKNLAAQEGIKVANKQMASTYGTDEEERKGNTMPNMESLRTMASRWTKMYRNRLVAMLGEIRSSDQPVEFMLGEDRADCSQYLDELKRDPDPMGIEERVRTQPLLDPITRAQQIEKRYNLCRQMKRQNVYAVNPTADGDQVKPGSKEGEGIDAWRARVNIATIDYAGIDPNSLPKPSNAVLTRQDVTGDVYEYDAGGQEFQIQRQTNARQIAGYNRAIDESAARLKAMSVLLPGLDAVGQSVSKWKIKTASMNLVELNGLTPEMKNELKDTQFAAAQPKGDSSPERSLELTPEQLTVKAIR